MKFTIVTISYNQGRYLQECLRSVEAQGYDDLDHVIVDPGSVDGSREIICHRQKSFARMILEPDQGPADGLNKGFREAGGEIFFCLNADDFLLPGALRSIADAFRRFPGADVIYGNAYLADENGRLIGKLISSPWDIEDYAYGVISIPQQATFFRREIFQRSGGAFNTSNITCWDGELLVDLALQGAVFKRINAFLGAFRIHKASLSGSGRLRNQYREEKGRLFSKVMGRPFRPADRLLRIARKIGLLLNHPLVGLARAGAKMAFLWRGR